MSRRRSKHTTHPTGSQPFTFAGRGCKGTGLLYPSGAVAVTSVDGHALTTRLKSWDAFTHRFKVTPSAVTWEQDTPQRVEVTLSVSTHATAAEIAEQLQALAACSGHIITDLTWKTR